MTVGILSWLIWLPIFIGVFIGVIGECRLSDKWVRRLGLGASIGLCYLGYIFFKSFDPSAGGIQFLENYQWIPAMGVSYKLGVDGIAVLLILLTLFIHLIVVVAALKVVTYKASKYYALFFCLTGIMIGAFSARDSMLFYFFWEASLIPMYLIIGMWGGKERAYAAVKFFLYTFLGSVLMLIALIFVALRTGSFDMDAMMHVSLSQTEQFWVALAFFAAFAVKIPMWPVHTWLPDAHTEAPAGGSAVLAALMLKLGAYGFIRFSLPMVAQMHAQYDWVFIILSLIAIVYVGLATIVQKDIKRLIAYSSVSHMGIVTLGMFLIFMLLKNSGHQAYAILSLQGAIFQMISHGFSSAALFLGIGFIYERFHTRRIDDYGGLAHTMPKYAGFTLLFAMANVGLPGTSGFVGEFMVILSAFKAHFWIACTAGLTLILAPAYTLWMFKRVMFGKIENPAIEKAEDLCEDEILLMIMLAVPTILFGLYPAGILDVSEVAVTELVQHIAVRM